MNIAIRPGNLPCVNGAAVSVDPLLNYIMQRLRSRNKFRKSAILVVVLCAVLTLLQLLRPSTQAEGVTSFNGRVVIAGPARNVARHMAYVMPVLLETGKLFSDGFDIVVYENGSTDSTLQRLRAWQKSIGPRFHIIHETDVPGRRTERLAHARNMLLDKARSIQPEYLMMVDFDNVNSALGGIQTCGALPSDWAACCANQRSEYYDLWALRTFDNWVDIDILRCNDAAGKPILDVGTCIEKNGAVARMRHIPADVEPIKVKSCFGGAALYKFDLAQWGTYNGTSEAGLEMCEHVPFSESIRRRDHSAAVYINPAMLNDRGHETLWLQIKKLAHLFFTSY